MCVCVTSKGFGSLYHFIIILLGSEIYLEGKTMMSVQQYILYFNFLSFQFSSEVKKKKKHRRIKEKNLSKTKDVFQLPFVISFLFLFQC